MVGLVVHATTFSHMLQCVAASKVVCHRESATSVDVKNALLKGIELVRTTCQLVQKRRHSGPTFRTFSESYTGISNRCWEMLRDVSFCRTPFDRNFVVMSMSGPATTGITCGRPEPIRGTDSGPPESASPQREARKHPRHERPHTSTSHDVSLELPPIDACPATARCCGRTSGRPAATPQESKGLMLVWRFGFHLSTTPPDTMRLA